MGRTQKIAATAGVLLSIFIVFYLLWLQDPFGAALWFFATLWWWVLAIVLLVTVVIPWIRK